MRDESPPPLRVFAYDARGHGATQCADNTTLSAEMLTEDGIAVVRFLYNRLVAEQQLEQTQNGQKEQQLAAACAQERQEDGEAKFKGDSDTLPSVILVGHRWVLFSDFFLNDICFMKCLEKMMIQVISHGVVKFFTVFTEHMRIGRYFLNNC